MSLKTETIRNIASNWTGLFVNMVVGFFLAPFILHRLGNVAFGLYVLVFSFTGYYGLFDFGISSSIVRHVARFNARGEKQELNRLVNTSLCSYSVLAILLLGVTGIGSYWVGALFHLSPSLIATARILFVAVGGGIALGFPLSVFSAILEGLRKFYSLNLVQVVSTLLRAGLIIIALTHGGGLLSVAFITIGLNLLSYVPYIVIVHNNVPVSLGLRFVDRSTFKMMASYGSATFIISIGEKLRFQTDAIVIGMFLSAAAITFFSIGSKLVDYLTGIVQYLAQVFTPMSSHFDATGDVDSLRKLLVVGNRACALIALPICAVLLILGKPIIAAWVGPAYLSSYSVLVLLVIPRTFYVCQATSNKIMFGMNRHRPLAVALLIEGVANLILSIVLAKRWGIEGVAIGTAIPLTCTSLLFLPRYVCRLVKMPISSFLAQSYVLPLAICAPLVLTLLLSRRLFAALTIANLIGQLLVSGLVYGVAVGWWFLTREALGVNLRIRFTKYVHQSLGR